jgi:hypothetical protein
MPFITKSSATGLTLAAIGLIVPASAAGGLWARCSLVCGSMQSDAMVCRPAALLLAAARLAAVLRAGCSSSRFTLWSAAQGALSTGINARIADAKRTARACALNLLHGVYGIGSHHL